MVTIKDIARMAGVSYTTVSKALNGEPGVRQQTRDKIMSIAKRLNYVPNLAAQRLVDRKSKSIGLVWPRNAGLFPFHVFNQIHAEAEARGYTAMLSLGDGAAAIRSFSQHFIDNIILWSSAVLSSPEFLKARESFQGTIVALGAGQKHHLHSVSFDREGAVYQAVKHLADLGHRRISFLGQGGDNEKTAGFMKGLLDYQLEHTPYSFISLDYKSPDSWDTVKQLLRQEKQNRPTAIIMGGQSWAFQMMKLLRSQQIRVPEDMSLIVYDDVPEMTELMDIPMTTIGPNARELAVTALDIISGQADHPNKSEWVHTLIPSHLNARQSTRTIL